VCQLPIYTSFRIKAVKTDNNLIREKEKKYTYTHTLYILPQHLRFSLFSMGPKTLDTPDV